MNLACVNQFLCCQRWSDFHDFCFSVQCCLTFLHVLCSLLGCTYHELSKRAQESWVREKNPWNCWFVSLAASGPHRKQEVHEIGLVGFNGHWVRPRMNIWVFRGGFLLVENFRKDGGSAGKSMCLPQKSFCGIIEWTLIRFGKGYQAWYNGPTLWEHIQ